jgi:YHS domain-containing protein
VQGNVQWGVIHRGRTYLFAGPQEQQRFYADPDRYAPVLSGNDVVMAIDNGQMLAGRREFGAWYANRVFLFSSPGTLQAFEKDPQRYVREVERQITSATPEPTASPVGRSSNAGNAPAVSVGRY